MNQTVAEKISESILNWRDGESVLLIESPFESAEIPKPIATKHIGVRITIASQKRVTELLYTIQTILDKLETLAFNSQKNIDYAEIVQVKADKPEEVSTVIEIIEIQKGRDWKPED